MWINCMLQKQLMRMPSLSEHHSQTDRKQSEVLFWHREAHLPAMLSRCILWGQVLVRILQRKEKQCTKQENLISLLTLEQKPVWTDYAIIVICQSIESKSRCVSSQPVWSIVPTVSVYSDLVRLHSSSDPKEKESYKERLGGKFSLKL